MLLYFNQQVANCDWLQFGSVLQHECKNGWNQKHESGESDPKQQSCGRENQNNELNYSVQKIISGFTTSTAPFQITQSFNLLLYTLVPVPFFWGLKASVRSLFTCLLICVLHTVYTLISHNIKTNDTWSEQHWSSCYNRQFSRETLNWRLCGRYFDTHHPSEHCFRPNTPS